MKKIFVIILLHLLFFAVYSTPQYLNKTFIHTDEYSTLYISDTSIKLDDKIESGHLYLDNRFDIFRGSETNYIILNCTVEDTYFVYLIKSAKTQKYQFANWEITYDEIMKKTEYNAVKLVPFTLQSIESFIIEKDRAGNEIRFTPDIGDLFFVGSNPWAVKKDDKKVIYLSTERWRHPTTVYYPVSDIVFVNGFVYPDKDYLYEQNSRAKRVRISYNDTSFETELQDTGNFQVVHLPESIDPKAKNNVRIEILDYYPGSKYSDIVISGVYYMDAVLKK